MSTNWLNNQEDLGGFAVHFYCPHKQTYRFSCYMENITYKHTNLGRNDFVGNIAYDLSALVVLFAKLCLLQKQVCFYNKKNLALTNCLLHKNPTF